MTLLSKPHHGVAIARTKNGEDVFANFNLQDWHDEIERIEETLLEIDLSGQTAESIKTLYESNPDTNAFTNALLNKLNGVESGAEVNPSDAEIKTASGFTQERQDKLDNLEADAVLIKRVDIVADSPSAGETTIYKGFAEPGTADATPGWVIEQLILNAEDDIYDGGFAGGTVDKDKSWTNRLSETYF